MSRKGLEFKATAKMEMFRRAGGPENIHCEGCGLRLGGKPFDYDHSLEIWEMPSETRALFRKTGVPAEYGKLLGKACCHKPKSARKTAERAHCDRIIEKTARAKKTRNPLPGSKASGIRKRMNGTVERW